MISPTVVFWFGEGNGNPLQYSCLENSMDRGAWKAIVHEVAEWDVTLASFHVAPAVTGLRLKTMKMRIQFIQCSSPIQFLQVADFGFISTFYSCFMRENYSGRILLYSYLRWISIGFFSPELIIKMFLLCCKNGLSIYVLYQIDLLDSIRLALKIMEKLANLYLSFIKITY